MDAEKPIFFSKFMFTSRQLTLMFKSPGQSDVTKSLWGEVELEGKVDHDPPGAPTPTPDGPEEGVVLCEGALSVQIRQGRPLLVHDRLRSVC